MNQIIGRKKEIKQLTEYYHSGKAEFVAVYGRRRIGKTYLVHNLFLDSFAFEMSGSIDAPLEAQLSNFGFALREFGDSHQPIPSNWIEAFEALKQLLKAKLSGNRLVVFIDELPCLDTRKSGFQQAFEHFWNGWASKQNEIMLIVCGSATSWMITNLIDSHGGLHNRITHEMYLAPFTLGETEEMLSANGFTWSRLSILQMYSIIGGVPYYLSLLDKVQGVEGNVDRLFFSEHAELKREYGRLYASLFKNSEICMKIIEALASCKQGLTRKEIVERLKLPSGGTLTKVLRELIDCDFVRGYNTRERKIKQKDQIYQLIDLYTLFYMQFCHPASTDTAFWTHQMGKPRQNTWYGLAFERICMLHIPQIKQQLGIAQIYTEYYSWRSKLSTPASQIDLLIDRNDKTISICEMKYASGEYEITKAYANHVDQRLRTFRKVSSTKKSFSIVYITPFGLLNNMYARKVNRQITADDLFKKV